MQGVAPNEFNFRHDPGSLFSTKALSERTGRVKPDVAPLNGNEERHPEGRHYLAWREGAKDVSLSVAKTQPMQVATLAQGSRTECGEQWRRSFAAVADFLDETKFTKKPDIRASRLSIPGLPPQGGLRMLLDGGGASC
jgi:hypothetical protein